MGFSHARALAPRGLDVLVDLDPQRSSQGSGGGPISFSLGCNGHRMSQSCEIRQGVWSGLSNHSGFVADIFLKALRNQRIVVLWYFDTTDTQLTFSCHVCPRNSMASQVFHLVVFGALRQTRGRCAST